MDKFDQLLSKNPEGDLPDGFIERIRLNFRRRYHFRRRMLVLSAVFLIAVGLCLVFPEVAAADAQFNMPLSDGSSMPVFNPLSTLSPDSAVGLWQGITDIQDTILTTFSLPAWLGLFSVGIGSVIGIGGLFPRLRTR